MKQTPYQKGTSRISATLQHQLNLYVLSASAAGVGMLALTQPAEGKVLYTPAHKVVPINQALVLDLNHDGIHDFDVFNLTHNFESPRGTYLLAEPLNSGNEILAQGTSRGYGASALPEGFKVGPSKKFRAGRDLMAFCSTRGSVLSGGPWKNVNKRYLGLKFLVKGKTHYGWARFNVRITNQVHATLTGYAYETVAERPIVTGKTNNRLPLGALARGR